MARTGARGGTIVDRLTEVLFLQLLDYYVENNESSSGFLVALRDRRSQIADCRLQIADRKSQIADRRLQYALALVHTEPAFNWTLAALGERVGMSRATLVRHFHNAVGVAPMTYVANW